MTKKSIDLQPESAPDLEWMSLAEATVAFAPRSLQKRLQALSKKPWPTMNDKLATSPNWPELKIYLSQFLDDQRSRSEPYWEMRANCLEKLQTGVLEASGVRVPATVSSGIEVIPAHLFDERPRIDWNRNTLKNYGVEFHRVRVRSRSISDSLNIPLKSSSRRQGRPSKESDIERAIDYALENGIELKAMPRKQAIEQICKSAEILGFSMRIGFSVSVVQRVLHRRFGSRV